MYCVFQQYEALASSTVVQARRATATRSSACPSRAGARATAASTTSPSVLRYLWRCRLVVVGDSKRFEAQTIRAFAFVACSVRTNSSRKQTACWPTTPHSQQSHAEPSTRNKRQSLRFVTFNCLFHFFNFNFFYRTRLVR